MAAVKSRAGQPKQGGSQGSCQQHPVYIYGLLPVFAGPLQAGAANAGGLFRLCRSKAHVQEAAELSSQLLPASWEPLLIDALAPCCAPQSESVHAPDLPTICSSPSGSYLLIVSWDGGGVAAKASPPNPGKAVKGRGGGEMHDACRGVVTYLVGVGNETESGEGGKVGVLEKLPGYAVWDSRADRCGCLLEGGAIRVLDLSEARRQELTIQAPELKGARAVIGGALLSVVLDWGGAGQSESAGRNKEHVMVMLDWGGGVVSDRQGSACPRDVVWTGDGSAAALLYDSQVVVLANRHGKMQPVRVLRIGAQSACWCHASGWECGRRESGNSLFMCTSDAILAWNPIMGQAPAVLLASRSHATCDAKAGEDAALPRVHPMPSGSLLVLGCLSVPHARYLLVGVQGASARVAALSLAACETAGGWGGRLSPAAAEEEEALRRQQAQQVPAGRSPTHHGVMAPSVLTHNGVMAPSVLIPQGKSLLILM